jgi:predicted ribonuclease YlaK
MGNNEKYLADKKMFADARKTLDEMQKKVKILKKNWDESRVEYVKRTRYEKREQLLDKHVKDRRCPVCDVIKLESRRWVLVSEDEALRVANRVSGLGARDFAKALIVHQAVCLSCWQLYVRRGK